MSELYEEDDMTREQVRAIFRSLDDDLCERHRCHACPDPTQLNLNAAALLFTAVVSILLGIIGILHSGSNALGLVPGIFLGAASITCLRAPTQRTKTLRKLSRQGR